MMADQIEGFIICPYCDYIFPVKSDYPEKKDVINGMDMECINCERVFKVICELNWTFRTYQKYKKEGE